MNHPMPRLLPIFLLMAFVPLASLAEPKVDSTATSGRSWRRTASPATAPTTKHRKADLRLDTRDGPFDQGDGKAPVVPRRAWRKSELVRRIPTADADERMPPPKSGKKLDAGQIETAPGSGWRKGRSTQGHWAFSADAAARARAVEQPRVAANPIDHFILARLEKEGLTPSPEADRATLIRRVTLDLTGLPPTPAEVDAFLADDARRTPTRRLVDRLLASPHYGERMARRLARRRPLRRHARLPHRQRPRHDALARLGDRRVQPQHAVRPVHDRAARRRPAARTRRSSRRSPAGSTATT